MSGLKAAPPSGSAASAIQAISQAFSHHSQMDDANIKIMTAAIIVLFCVVFFIIGLHLCAKWFWRNAHLRPRRPAPDYSSDDAQQSTGLDKAVIESLPTFTYAAGSMTKEVECVVCLCEFEDKAKGRFLPKCRHIFHTDCIDMWFRSHSTCPLCRLNIDPTVKAETINPLGDALAWSSVPIDFSSLEHVLLLEHISHQPQELDDNADATVLQLVQGISSVYPQEGLQPSPASESKALGKQQGQWSSMLGCEQEGSVIAGLHLAIELPRPSSDSACALCPKSPLSRFSLRRILSRDRKITPSASTSTD
ncbi:hypothetical protein O6H91_19G010000 [Diphasiastrum complanatum]|uniref:Uncharacterized protein n=1 Tax=Diphasiastrum complanatum TaxID=34168 RepID=A0ACC2ASL8_DIPCM|nr:hypothetical protein O6H91_19G010000 [Diphasiastrum complanatum]